MTYFGVLIRFIIPLTLLFAALAWWDQRQGRSMPASLRGRRPLPVLAAHIIVALIWTTPWDNYLVATEVWGYRPESIWGITLGWVPLEEYLFFILQTLLVGFLLIWLAPRLAAAPQVTADPRIGPLMTAPLALFWLAALVVLLLRWAPGNYLALTLIWMLPPVMLQAWFGGDILWHHRRLVFSLIGLMTLYLWGVDYIAIASGAWHISGSQTLGIQLGGVLPLEEMTFFFVTTLLIVFGMTLVMAVESQRRVGDLRLPILGRVAGNTALDQG